MEKERKHLNNIKSALGMMRVTNDISVMAKDHLETAIDESIKMVTALREEVERLRGALKELKQRNLVAKSSIQGTLDGFELYDDADVVGKSTIVSSLKTFIKYLTPPQQSEGEENKKPTP